MLAARGIIHEPPLHPVLFAVCTGHCLITDSAPTPTTARVPHPRFSHDVLDLGIVG